MCIMIVDYVMIDMFVLKIVKWYEIYRFKGLL